MPVPAQPHSPVQKQASVQEQEREREREREREQTQVQVQVQQQQQQQVQQQVRSQVRQWRRRSPAPALTGPQSCELGLVPSQLRVLRSKARQPATSTHHRNLGRAVELSQPTTLTVSAGI